MRDAWTDGHTAPLARYLARRGCVLAADVVATCMGPCLSTTLVEFGSSHTRTPKTVCTLSVWLRNLHSGPQNIFDDSVKQSCFKEDVWKANQSTYRAQEAEKKIITNGARRQPKADEAGERTPERNE